MTRDTKLYYEDINKTIAEVADFIGNLTFDDFTKDTKAVRAVTMNFIVIGEAAKHVPAEVKETVSSDPLVKSGWYEKYSNPRLPRD